MGNLEEKCLHVVSLDAKLSFTSPNEFELNAPKFKLAGQTDSSHDIADLGLYLKTLSDTQSSDNAAVSASVASNTTALATLDTREAANHSAQGALLGSETARASAAEAALDTKITAEETRAVAAESVANALLITESQPRFANDAAIDTAYKAADANLQSQIDALGVTDTSTLASINSMLADYQAADNTISGLITALTTRVATLESQIATLLN